MVYRDEIRSIQFYHPTGYAPVIRLFSGALGRLNETRITKLQFIEDGGPNSYEVAVNCKASVRSEIEAVSKKELKDKAARIKDFSIWREQHVMTLMDSNIVVTFTSEGVPNKHEVNCTAVVQQYGTFSDMVSVDIKNRKSLIKLYELTFREVILPVISGNYLALEKLGKNRPRSIQDCKFVTSYHNYTL